MDVVFSEEFPPENVIKAVRFLDDRPQCLIVGFASAEMILIDLSAGTSNRTKKSGRLSVKSSQVDIYF